jgi:hypothetical protein
MEDCPYLSVSKIWDQDQTNQRYRTNDACNAFRADAGAK